MCYSSFTDTNKVRGRAWGNARPGRVRAGEGGAGAGVTGWMGGHRERAAAAGAAIARLGPEVRRRRPRAERVLELEAARRREDSLGEQWRRAEARLREARRETGRLEA